MRLVKMIIGTFCLSQKKKKKKEKEKKNKMTWKENIEFMNKLIKLKNKK